MTLEAIRERRFSSILAGVLSLVIPGLGQLYKGQFLRAVVWFCSVSVTYWLLWWLLFPGIILHALCVLGAAFGSAGKERIRLPR